MEDMEADLLQADRMNGNLRSENELLKSQLESKEERMNELQRSLMDLQIDPLEVWRKEFVGSEPKKDRLKTWGIAFFLGVVLGKRI